MKIDSILNEEQLAAVTHKKGPLLIIAGAGTGKTTVITERIKWLITRKGAKPAEILALTFTEKAASKMEERVDLALPYGYLQMWITTFHAFGDRILKQEAHHIGLNPGYKILTAAESIIFFRKNLFKFNLNLFRPLGNPTKFIVGLLQHFSRLKDEDISPRDYALWVNKQRKSKLNISLENGLDIKHYEELSQCFRRYEELKVTEGVMDFSDLIGNALLLFRTKKSILKYYQNQFKYILIDEFQDTNFSQNELSILLAGEKKNITVVGDDDQAIYRWRGAAISNIIQFRSRFPQTKITVLTKNYRSTAEILDKSYTLINFNNPDRLEIKTKVNKKLIPERKIIGKTIEFLWADRVENEADLVAKKIKEIKENTKDKLTNDQYEWKDFAILVRANNYAEPFTKAFQRKGIPYQFVGPPMLFRQPEVKDLIAYLKLLDNYEDSVAVYRVLSMPVFGLSPQELITIINYSKRIGLSLFEAVDILYAGYARIIQHWSANLNYRHYIPLLSAKTQQTIVNFIKMVNYHQSLVRSESAGQILFYFLEESKLLLKLTEFKTAKEEIIAQNISKFFDRLKYFESIHEDAHVSAVVDWIDMSMELGESPQASELDWSEVDAVNILTVHTSKGLEFPVVFIVNAVAHRFPTIERHERIPIPDSLIKEILPLGDYHLQEERRLFYVAMTRARDLLFISAAKYYAEAKRERKISQFVYEALGNELSITKDNLLEKNKATQMTLLEWKKTPLPLQKQKSLDLNYLSYSQINTFLTCPLQYKYRYLLKIPISETAAGSFGTSIHLALQKFYELVKQEKKPNKRELLATLDKVWLPIGYGSRSYEEKMRLRGKNMLIRFYDQFYDPSHIPHSLEQLFTIKLTQGLSIGGKIDRVDKINGKKLEIVDYKTGKRPDDKDIAGSLQMTIYAMAAKDKGIYNTTPENVILTFYFLETREKVSSSRTSEQMDKAREKLIKLADEIRLSNFEPKVGPWCDFCNFRLICEAWQ